MVLFGKNRAVIVIQAIPSNHLAKQLNGVETLLLQDKFQFFVLMNFDTVEMAGNIKYSKVSDYSSLH